LTILEWIALVVVLMIVAGIVNGADPVQRFWADKRSGEGGAVDPTGRPISEDSEFERPPNAGDLL
jgi:hypothetical protein